MSLSTRLYSVLEGVTIALDALRANKVRAALTILGVGVGVFVVVLIAGAIHGINSSVAKDFEKAGPSTFFLSRYPMNFGPCESDEDCPWIRNPQLSKSDIDFVASLPDVESVTPRITDQGPVAFHDRSLPGVNIIGYGPAWTDVGGGDLYPGRSFTPSENMAGARVAVVNQQAADALFGDVDPVGKMITVEGQPFEVIGVYHYVASFLSGGNDPRIMVPYETARRHLRADPRWMMMTVKPRAGIERDDAIDQVTVALRSRRGLKPRADNTFAIITQDKLFETYNKIFGMFFLVMIALSAVGTIVGGVGVIAIMMISVTERTREIGVRKALGATRRTILWQFLVEAVTLTGIGVFAGLFVGWLGTIAMRSLTPIAASIPPTAILLAILGSVVTGVVFGMLPALRASRLDPVEALRYE